MTIEQILNNKIIEDRGYTTPCWIWQGALVGKSRFKRGSVWFKNKYWLVHRLIHYIHKPTEYKEELQVLHKCDVTMCFNPDHLFSGTNNDNIADMCNKGRHWRQKTTHCPQGHEYTKENTYINPRRKTRSCLECRRLRNNKLL